MDYSEQYDKIYRYCYFRVQNREAAEDITQEAFLRFLKHEEYQRKGKDLQYLYTIAGNLCIDEYRRRAAAGVTEEFSGELDETGSFFHAAESAESTMLETLAMKLALETLSPSERELVLLRYVNEVPVRVLCELKECSRFTLNRRLKQVLKKLRTCLSEEETAENAKTITKTTNRNRSSGFGKETADET